MLESLAQNWQRSYQIYKPMFVRIIESELIRVLHDIFADFPIRKIISLWNSVIIED